jgi:hypothetical protein
VLKLPESYDTLEDEDEKARIRTQVEKSIILWTYETETKETNPILFETMHIAQGRTRGQTVDFAANTWDGDILPFRQCLIRVARYVDPVATTRKLS